MKNLLFAISFIMLNASTCVMDDDKVSTYDAYIIVQNNTSLDMLYVLSYDNDTLLEEFSFLKDNTQMELATIQAYNKSGEIGCDKEYLLNGGVYNLFLFDKQTVIKQPWDTIVERNMVLKRYDLNLHDLEAKNWTITYP
jgi:hypothetical protein